LNPAPEPAVRVSKRAGIAVLCVIAVVVGLIAFGIYYRQQRQFRSPFGAKEEKTVSAATAAGREIASEIPAGVVNLAAQGQRPESGTDTQSTPAKRVRQGRSSNPTNRAATVSGPPPAATAGSFHDATPDERRLAAAYEREQQALIAPTIVRGGNGSYPAAPQPPPSPDGSLASLAQTLAARQPAGGSTDPNVQHSSYDEQNMQSQKQAFLAQSRSSVWNDYLKSTRTPPVSKYEIKAGWEIPAVLEQGLNSDLPGELKALVTSGCAPGWSLQFRHRLRSERRSGRLESHHLPGCIFDRYRGHGGAGSTGLLRLAA
jgi:type IV secretion system protein VirB10